MQQLHFTRTRRRSSAISLTPLIDVVFMLLLFFMLATSFEQWRSIDLSPPGQDDAQSSSRQPPLILTVHRDRLELDSHSVALANLGSRIADRKRASNTTDLVLITAHDVLLQRLVTVLDALRQQGVADPILSIGP